MFMTPDSPAKAYAHVGIETSVMTANSHKLILMLFDGALLALSKATLAINEGKIAAKGEAISQAIDIVTNGLKASLDQTNGGELAQRLSALYSYMGERLLHANLRSDKAAIEEVSGLLRELRGAWEEIAEDPAVVSASKKVA